LALARARNVIFLAVIPYFRKSNLPFALSVGLTVKLQLYFLDSPPD
jgi:hypothetical protein